MRVAIETKKVLCSSALASLILIQLHYGIMLLKIFHYLEDGVSQCRQHQFGDSNGQQDHRLMLAPLFGTMTAGPREPPMLSNHCEVTLSWTVAGEKQFVVRWLMSGNVDYGTSFCHRFREGHTARLKQLYTMRCKPRQNWCPLCVCLFLIPDGTSHTPSAVSSGQMTVASVKHTWPCSRASGHCQLDT